MAKKGKYLVVFDGIDGRHEDSFHSMAKLVEYVRSHEDFGEDGRRSYGVQGEFGIFYFIGFGWSDILAFEAKAAGRARDVREWVEMGHREFSPGLSEFRLMRGDGELLGSVSRDVGPDWKGEIDLQWSAVLAIPRGGKPMYDPLEDYSPAKIGEYRSVESAMSAVERLSVAPSAGADSIYRIVNLVTNDDEDLIWGDPNAAAVGDVAEIPF
jgi:hypothetical protein